MSRNIFKPKTAHIKAGSTNEPLLPLIQILHAQADQATSDQAATNDQAETETVDGEAAENS